jgi:hypothetical protein
LLRRGVAPREGFGHSTILPVAGRASDGGLLRVSSTRTVEVRSNALHFILYVKLEFLKPDFFDEVFGVEVGRLREFLEFCFVLLMLLGQTLILGV